MTNIRAAHLRVVETNPLEDSRWHTFVAAHPARTIYHHSLWLEVLRREYSRQATGLACTDAEGRLRGVLALLETRGLPLGVGPTLGRRLSSLPRTPVAGPLALDEDAAAALVRAAVDLVRGRRNTSLQLKVDRPALDGVAPGLVRSPWRPSYLIRLPDDPARLRFGDGRNHRRIAWAVHHAEGMGVRVRSASTTAELHAWYALYLATTRKHAIPPRPYRLFQAMWDVLRPNGLMSLLLAEQRSPSGPARILAGAVLLRWGTTVFHAFAGWRSEDNTLRGNDIVHWNAIRDACRDGFAWYDLGEVDPAQPSLAGYKAKWANEVRDLHRYYFPARRPGENASGVPTSVERFVSAGWKALPLWATAALGDRIYAWL
jgi:hypothetical protein